MRYSPNKSCSRPEAASDVIFVWLIVADKAAKCRDPHINRFGEIRPEAVWDGILAFFAMDDVCDGRRTTADVGHDIRQKRHSAFC